MDLVIALSIGFHYALFKKDSPLMFRAWQAAVVNLFAQIAYALTRLTLT